ncbi:MAG: hypothetical protein AAF415_20415 [Pseudomonadota bacterium]
MVVTACGPSEAAQRFSRDNRITSVSVPHTGAFDWDALNCAAYAKATEMGLGFFAHADIVMAAPGGYGPSPSVLTNAQGDRRVFAMYGFYESEDQWRAVKDSRIDPLVAVAEKADVCRASTSSTDFRLIEAD